MKRIIALLIILTFASLAFEASAQQMVGKGQLRKYLVNQPSTSKFSWTILKKDGVSLADPAKYKIFRNKPINPVTALSEDFSTPSQSQTGGTLDANNSVYVYWLGDENQEFIVSAREYDVVTECSNKVYNTIKQNVKVMRYIDMFRANLSWADKKDFNADGVVDNLDVFNRTIPAHIDLLDCNTITSTPIIPATATTPKETKYYSTFSFNVKVWNPDKAAANKWFYKYKYIVADNVFASPSDKQWLDAPSFDSNKIDGNIDTNMIVLDEIEIEKGDGLALVWMKLILVKDAHNTSALDNPETKFITHAVVKKVPKDQVIRLVD